MNKTWIKVQPAVIIDRRTGEKLIIKRGMNVKKMRRMRNRILKMITVTLSLLAFILGIIAVGEDTEFLMSLKCLAGVYAIMFLWVMPFCKANHIFEKYDN